MASMVKIENFVQALANEEVDIFGTTDTFRAVIIASADTPSAATDDELADWTQVTGTGYAAGGDDIGNDGTRTGGTLTMTAADHTWTATAADWTAGQEIGIHDDTSTNGKLMCYFDYGAPFTLGNGETFTVNYGASLATLA
jgi:hypothetical protein